MKVARGLEATITIKQRQLSENLIIMRIEQGTKSSYMVVKVNQGNVRCLNFCSGIVFWKLFRIFATIQNFFSCYPQLAIPKHDLCLQSQERFKGSYRVCQAHAIVQRLGDT